MPNTQQQVLAFGADCDPVWKMLLTAKRLFESKLLGDAFDYQRPIDLTFEALKDVIAMQEMRLQLEAELTAVSESLASLAPKNRGLSVPSVGGVRTRVETFLQKADHAIGDLFEIVKQFYPGQVSKKWFASLLELVKEKYGADAQFTKFVVEVLPFVKFVRNARNCVEHPKADQRLEVSDFVLLPNLQLQPPILEVIHPDTPQPPIAIRDFMARVEEQIAGIFELMLVFLCGYNIQPFAGLPIQVVLYPPDLQKAFRVRYGYGMYDGDRVVPFG